MIILTTSNYLRNWLVNTYRMNFYLLYKSLHLIAVISWMAGLLYLPRLFVYHSLSEINSIQSETFKIMERKLLKAIMLPSIIFVFGSGLLMIYLNYYLIFELYFQIKVVFVLLMGYIHGKYSRMCKEISIITPRD